MSTSDDFLGRMQSNWRRRSGERTTFADEFRLVPSWLVRVIIFLYGLALAIVTYLAVTNREILVDPLVDKAAAIRILGMAGIVTGIAIPVAAFVFLIGYIGQDAKRRGMSPVLWVVAAIVVPYLIGIIIYFVVREPLSQPCPRCGQMMNARFNYCPGCQFNLRPNCPQCRREVHPGDRFCPYCGFALQSAVPAPVRVGESV
ncbi:MAG TPA: zinc ribbon domain-containing protein [Terriglobia bacterium]